MFENLKPELDVIFNGGARYGEEELRTPQGVIYDTLISELTDQFWDDLRAVLLKSGLEASKLDQFLSAFQEELRLKYPYLSRTSLVQPLFEDFAKHYLK